MFVATPLVLFSYWGIYKVYIILIEVLSNIRKKQCNGYCFSINNMKLLWKGLIE